MTQRSDIYALGLVLFELFTGKRVLEANTLNELLRLQGSSPVATSSSVVRDLDPAIERAIQRCLVELRSARRSSAGGSRVKRYINIQGTLLAQFVR